VKDNYLSLIKSIGSFAQRFIAKEFQSLLFRSLFHDLDAFLSVAFRPPYFRKHALPQNSRVDAVDGGEINPPSRFSARFLKLTLAN